MKLVLKGQEIFERSGVENIHQLALKIQVSYPTIVQWISKPEELNGYHNRTLARLLTEGLGLTPEEVLSSPMSDFFEFVEEEGKK